MGFVVKNTTKFGPLDLLCPHTCRGCGHLGTIFCECCKKNLLTQRQIICPLCRQKVAKSTKKVINVVEVPILDHQHRGDKCTQAGIKALQRNCTGDVGSQTKAEDWIKYQKCQECASPFIGLWCFGWREGVLEKLVEEYKYQSIRATGKILAELYDTMLPQGLDKIVVVPLPTIGKHIRARGFDHTLTVAKKLAKRRGWECQQILARAIDTVQVGSKMSERKIQAQKAYAVVGQIDSEKHYLLLDDVWTTGATMLAAEKVLRKAGAQQISAAVLAVSRLKAE